VIEKKKKVETRGARTWPSTAVSFCGVGSVLCEPPRQKKKQSQATRPDSDNDVSRYERKRINDQTGRSCRQCFRGGSIRVGHCNARATLFTDRLSVQVSVLYNTLPAHLTRSGHTFVNCFILLFIRLRLVRPGTTTTRSLKSPPQSSRPAMHTLLCYPLQPLQISQSARSVSSRM
jgi:hypothetical protein